MRTSRNSSSAIASSALALALAPLLSGCAPAEAARRPNVILICLDTVRADHFGSYGYERHETTPFLDELAARSTRFADTSATAGWTKPSVPSFLTGTWPCQHGVYEGSARARAGAVTDVLPEESTTLAEVFGDAGYDTAAFIRNAQLRRGNGFEQGFDRYEDRAGDARDIRWQALDWIDDQASEQPFFLYLHFLDAHWPYDVPDEYATRFASAEEIDRFRSGDSRALRDAINDGDVPFGETDRLALEALYDGSIRYLDDQLAQLAAGLALRGLEEDTIVCIVSDHGEEFGERGRIGHGHGLWENLLQVPWILHVPGAAPATVTSPVSLVDLFPTLLSAAGLRVPETSEGVDRLRSPDLATPILAEHKAPDKYLQSLRGDEHKLISTFRPQVADPGRKTWPMRPGERWEAEVQEHEDGRLRATQLKPRDEDADDPLEIKGLVADLDGETFTLLGIPVRLGPDVLLTSSEGSPAELLALGQPVKVTGDLVEGTLVAERLKGYDPREELVPEVRGPVTAVVLGDAGSELRLGPIAIEFDGLTELKNARMRSSRPRLTRAQVLERLEAGGAEFTSELFALGDDPDELSPLDGEGTATLRARLDALVRELVTRRTFGTLDQRTLSDDALRDLQAIGYGR
jgi:arylsulfatase